MGRRFRFSVFAFVLAIVGVLTGQTAIAQEFGSFSLQRGQTKQIRIGSTYRTIRLCNDAESAGTLDASIGGHNMLHLAPSLCAEDSGDTIQLSNAANGPVSGIYRHQYDFFDGP
jgi:hypothetical protein